MASKNRSWYSRFSTFEQYQNHLNKNIPLGIDQPVPVPTFQVSVFPSGELSASYYLAGSLTKHPLPSRALNVTTERLSSRSVQKIRRATENSQSPWKTFVTLTFDPRTSQPDERGYVNQTWAKGQLIRFRKALTMKINRMIEVKLRKYAGSPDKFREENAFRYIWVAELQDNGNIHFHFMFNQFFTADYLRKLWGQGQAAVNCKFIKNASHAAAYICKYITKEQDGRCKRDSSISGNRYNISRLLREDSMPTKDFKYDDEAIQAKKLLALMVEMVEKRGGKVIDSGFGMVIPRPSRPVRYQDNKTKTFKSRRGVCFDLAPRFLDTVFGAVPF